MTSTEYQQLVEFLGRQFTELRQEMLGHFDEIFHRFQGLEQEDTPPSRS